MTDITMCLNRECALNRNCYRFMAKPSPENQSYSRFEPTTIELFAKPSQLVIICDYFLQNKE